MNTERTANEALILLRVLRAWAHTPEEDVDDGRAHPLYPCNVPLRNGHFDEAPLWHAVQKLLDENGYT